MIASRLNKGTMVNLLLRTGKMNVSTQNYQAVRDAASLCSIYSLGVLLEYLDKSGTTLSPNVLLSVYTSLVKMCKLNMHYSTKKQLDHILTKLGVKEEQEMSNSLSIWSVFAIGFISAAVVCTTYRSYMYNSN